MKGHPERRKLHLEGEEQPKLCSRKMGTGGRKKGEDYGTEKGTTRRKQMKGN